MIFRAKLLDESVNSIDSSDREQDSAETVQASLSNS